LGLFLFAAAIQAALDALPQKGALHRWYLDDGVFMGSVAEAEEVLGALQLTLPPLGLELNLRKTTVWGPDLVPAEVAAASPQASDRTAAAVRALLAEGAPGRALRFLTSDGVCDSADPAVLACLREQNPQAEGPNLEPPLSQDRPDVGPPAKRQPRREPCGGRARCGRHTVPSWALGRTA